MLITFHDSPAKLVHQSKYRGVLYGAVARSIASKGDTCLAQIGFMMKLDEYRRRCLTRRFKHFRTTILRGRWCRWTKTVRYWWKHTVHKMPNLLEVLMILVSRSLAVIFPLGLTLRLSSVEAARAAGWGQRLRRKTCR